MQIVLNHETGVVFNAVTVRTGDSYGLDGCLTHDDARPMIEFYDARYPHTKQGQFVARYYVSTLREHIERGPHGLCLYGGAPDWNIDAAGMRTVAALIDTIV